MIGPFPNFSNHLQAPTMSESEITSGTGLRKTRVGVVTSDAMQKTIVVEVRRRVPHPRFKKIVKRTSTFYAHDENGEAKVGDRVLIEETRPLSKTKCWKLKEVLSH
ncbi:MAG: small subunit ribosomal protein S17 [Verrucomicrobia bacterium]|nr:MAG: small subunit ribosomal protein S17 [Verrucomicrobiota bacterium]